jgi:phosphoadenosine phosphosulfate reductase
MSIAEIASRVTGKLNDVRAALAAEVTGKGDVCLTCSFQAEDVLLTKLALELDATIPILFLETGYHFKETYEYRDRIAQEWNLNLINLLPEKTVAEQEAAHGLLYQTAPDQCCKLRKVEPLFKAVGEYRVWLTGLRREQAKSRAALEESALFTLPGGRQVLKLAPLADWTTQDVWYCLRRTFDSAASVVCAWILIDRLRAMYLASTGSQ